MAMCRYIYAYRVEPEDGEVFVRVPRFPEIISSIDEDEFRSMDAAAVEAYAHDAVVTALQAMIAFREEIPPVDDTGIVQADGFVRLTVRESMKLALYALYKENCNSVSEFARQLGKPETAARRLLNLRHGSKPGEIEKAAALFGKRIVHDWALEAA